MKHALLALALVAGGFQFLAIQVAGGFQSSAIQVAGGFQSSAIKVAGGFQSSAAWFSGLNALTVCDTHGWANEFTYAELASLATDSLATVRSKDGETRRDIWQGFRFDSWLKEKLSRPYKIIRFESADRYLVSFSRAEFDTLAAWLAFAQNGEKLPEDGLRLIFPALRDQKWIRGLQRVVLEDLGPLGLPASFGFLDERLRQSPLLQDPAPFTNLNGYYFEALLPVSARNATLNVLFYSGDGMKLELEYPLHLAGAVIEASDDGFSLKSPLIPGGMWLKDIIYIQLGDTALIKSGNLNALIALNSLLDWDLGPQVSFVIRQGEELRSIPLIDVLERPELLAGVESFELQP